MKMVYTNENSFLASNVKNLIEAQGIAVFIKNEYSQGAVGETSAFDSWPEVWVFNDSDYEKSLEIVELSKSSNTAVDWICKNCSETNDPSFEVCWKCQSSNT